MLVAVPIGLPRGMDGGFINDFKQEIQLFEAEVDVSVTKTRIFGQQVN
jgi:hypothetical protein